METSRFGHDDACVARDFLLQKMHDQGLDRPVDAGMTLGSGLGSFAADQMQEGRLEVPFNDVYRLLDSSIPLIPEGHAVQGHAHKLVIGKLKGPQDTLVVAQSGREHPYEGVPTRRSAFWLRVMQMLKAPLWVGSNAAGVVTPDTLKPPALMAVMGDVDLNEKDSPLVGPNDSRFGPRFSHSSDQYTAENIALLMEAAGELRIPLQKGIYIRETGPSYESPEEVYRLRGILEEMWRRGGQQAGETRFQGDPVGVVGMSTTFEVDVTRHARQSEQNPAFGKGIAVVSAATNYSASLGKNGFEPPSGHEEVQENARAVQDRFGKLIHQFIIARTHGNASA